MKIIRKITAAALAALMVCLCTAAFTGCKKDKNKINFDAVAKTNGQKIASGDFADIGFIGYYNGVKFNGGESDSYWLGIGSGSFVPGFEEQIIGHRAGDRFAIDITFPEGYNDLTLSDGTTVTGSGAKVVFVVTINRFFAAADASTTDTAENNNLVTADYTIYWADDGSLADSKTNAAILLGSDSFVIDGIEEQLIGVKVGDSLELTGTYYMYGYMPYEMIVKITIKGVNSTPILPVD